MPKITIQIDGEGEEMAVLLESIARSLRTQRYVVVSPAKEQEEDASVGSGLRPKLFSTDKISSARSIKIPDAGRRIGEAMSKILAANPITPETRAEDLRTAVRKLIKDTFNDDSLSKQRLYYYCCPSQHPWQKALRVNNLREENGMIVVL